LREQAAHDAMDPITGEGRYATKQLQETLLHKNFHEFELAATELAVEIDYMSSLNHPNILKVRGLPLHGIRALMDGYYDSYFMICDRLQETLDDRINQWIKQPDTSCPNNLTKIEYFFQLATALKYLHNNRVVFRDLKPQNIAFFVNNHDQIILFDFGLAFEIPKNGNINDLFVMSGVGTRRHMAPEVVNDSRYNLKVDVYSWSMIFWEI
jgi:serine/threonine protein kinase